MKRISLVRRRDGETEPYDPERVTDAVRRALSAAGAQELRLAGEIGAVVALFLEKTFYDEIPKVDEIGEMVEKVLIETGYAGAAKAFILHRDRRSRLREAETARDAMQDATLFGPRVIMVEDAASGTCGAFSHEALARLLASDGLLPRAEAQEVAGRVEQRLRRAGAARAPASLVRALAEVEVFECTLALDVRRRAGAVIPPEDVASALHRRGAEGGAPFPRIAARDLGGQALRSHALSELLPADAARAHMTGDLHVHGLDLPAALFSASFSAEHVKEGNVPGGGTRGAAEAGASARRLACAVGRTARFVGGAVTGPVGVDLAALSFAPLLLATPRGELEEEAWHLLHATAADLGATPVELDLSPEVPDALADAHARDGVGRSLAVANGELADMATRFARALLRVRARGSGLPPRDTLAVPSLVVSERTLAGDDSCAVLRLALEAVLQGDRAVFWLARGGSVPGGTSIARPPSELSSPGAVAAPCAGRVTLNLPRAAALAGRGNVDGFLKNADRLIEHAMRVHRRRRELLAEVGGRVGGSLAPLFRGPRGRPGLFDLSRATWSVGVTGLNEAVHTLTGFELHDDADDALRVARRALEYLRLRVHSAGLDSDFAATLDADEDPRVADRLARLDRRHDPLGKGAPAHERFTPGVALRRDAPIDTLHRLECEEPLHASVRTSTLAIALRTAETGGADGLLVLLKKLLRAGSVSQVEFRPW